MRVIEGVLCVGLLALVQPSQDVAWHALAWVRHEMLFGFIAVQAAAWRILGRQIELRMIVLTLACGIYAFLAYYPLAFVMSFIAAQAVTELSVWWRMERF
ncbi:MAG: hypothetical protein AB7O49_18675 [Sphingomonadales bacterium]